MDAIDQLLLENAKNIQIKWDPTIVDVIFPFRPSEDTLTPMQKLADSGQVEWSLHLGREKDLCKKRLDLAGTLPAESIANVLADIYKDMGFNVAVNQYVGETCSATADA